MTEETVTITKKYYNELINEANKMNDKWFKFVCKQNDEWYIFSTVFTMVFFVVGIIIGIGL